jgi:hypothetical protein
VTKIFFSVAPDAVVTFMGETLTRREENRAQMSKRITLVMPYMDFPKNT